MSFQAITAAIRLGPRWLLLGAGLASAAVVGRATPVTAAPKTDIVGLRNGDRITCEIKRMERGRLSVKTDEMGTLDIEWDIVDTLRAHAMFQVEDFTGAHYYGALREGPRGGALSIESMTGVRTIDMLAVVEISRLGDTLWNRLDGAIDLGTSYTSASDLFTLDLAAETRYERPLYELGFDATATLTRQPEVEDTRRWSVGLDFLHRRPSHWLGFGQGLVEENDELGFKLRASLAAGLGRYLIKSSHDDFLIAAGLSVNREVPVEGETTVNPEYLLTLQYNRFSYDFPKVDFLASVTAFESFPDLGRARVEAEARLRRELITDFNLTLRVYESYDSQPATEGAERNDYGMTFGLGWSY